MTDRKETDTDMTGNGVADTGWGGRNAPDSGVHDPGVIIVGAGLAGLGAAAALRALGRRSIVLEASARVGGRAWTHYPPELGGVWFDMGAVWFHNAEHNPLVVTARAAGDFLLRSDELRREQTFIGDRPATSAELAAYADAWPHYEAMADRILATEGDVPLSEVTRRLPDILGPRRSRPGKAR